MSVSRGEVIRTDPLPVAELALNEQIALTAVGAVDNQIGVVAGAASLIAYCH